MTRGDWRVEHAAVTFLDRQGGLRGVVVRTLNGKFAAFGPGERIGDDFSTAADATRAIREASRSEKASPLRAEGQPQ
jgi:hypothetical protein